MCGIVAAAAGSNIVPVLVEGLKRLEYRGYDSAGIAVIGPGTIERVRSVGRVAELETPRPPRNQSPASPTPAGPPTACPSERNAHPHVSGSIWPSCTTASSKTTKRCVHELTAQGYVFTSDTDTESIAHLIQAGLEAEPDLFKAVQIACRQLVGAYAIAVIDHTQPGKIIVAREGSPLLLGVSDSGNYAASDASALLQVTRNMVYLENGDIAEFDRNSASGSPVSTAPRSSGRSMSPNSRLPPSNSAPTSTTCRRKSSSSPKRWPTRWKSSVAARASSPASSAPQPPELLGRR